MYGEECDVCCAPGPVEWSTYDLDGAKCYLCAKCRKEAEEAIEEYLASRPPAHQAVAIILMESD
jgi:hypothetical protein